MFAKPLAFVSGTFLNQIRKTSRPSRSQTAEFGYTPLEPRQLLATITWSTSVPIENSGAFVDNSSGSLVAAINADTNGEDSLINGVNFVGTEQERWNDGVTGVGGITISSNADEGNYGNTFVQGSGAPVGITDGGDIDNLVSSAIWNPQDVTLSGLTPGDTYFVQVIGNDSRDGRTDSYVTLLGDGTGTGNFTGLNFLSNSVSGGQGNLPGSAITGTFIADASGVQTFEVAGERNGSSSGGRAQINGLQLRNLESTVLLPGAVPFVNEFSASNNSIIDDDNGNSSDWIEIYNAGEDAVDLGGYSLTDDPTNPTKYVIPADTNLAGGEYLIIFAGDDADPTNGSDLYTGFGLAAGGEYVGFFDASGDLVNEFGLGGANYPAQFEDISYGVENDGSFDSVSFFATPTPGAANVDSVDGVIESLPTFSVERGFYDEAFTVDVRSTAPGTVLVYTTDGTDPSLSNGVQIGPASSTSLAETSLVISGTTSLRAASFLPDFFSRGATTSTYIFLDDTIASDLDPGITQDPRYDDLIRDSLLDIPTLSFNYQDEILDSDQAEQRASIEWIAPDGSEGFQIDAGIDAFGGRSTDFDKKSFRLHFRSEYGDSRLDFPLFEGFDRGIAPTESFDELEFRSGSHDMSMRGFYHSNRFVDDTLLEAGHVVPHGRFVHIYTNGVYWGQYHMRERWNADFLSQYYGGEEESFEAVNGNTNNGFDTPFGWDPGTVYDGDGTIWANIQALADTAGDGNPTGGFQELKELVNMEQYIDFMLVYMAGASENEYRTGGSADVGFTFYLNDADGWLRDPLDIRGRQGGDKTDNPGPGNILGTLVDEADPEFMILYADRIQRMFFNDGALTVENSVNRLQERLDEVELSFLAESARWGARSPSSYDAAADTAINDRLPELTQSMVSRLRAQGVLPSFDAPSFRINGSTQNGGDITAGDTLTFTASEPIYYTTDGSDPRLVGGGISPNATLFNSGAPVTLNTSTNVLARAFTNGKWSAVNDSLFAIPVSQSDLRISELHFNPADPSGSEIAAGFIDNDEFEFIELFNPSTTGTINLSGVQLSEGVTFQFSNVDLLPGERVVVVENVDAFMERYGDSATVAGQWSGGLSNSGEEVTLLDSSLDEIMSVNYGDNDPWYNAADGHGFSLVLEDPVNTPVDELGKYYSWRSSTLLGGTPGDASVDRTGVVINEVLAHTDAPQSDSIELFNPTSAAISVGGWYLSDEGDDLFKYQIAAGTTIAAGGYLVFDESDFNATATGFALSGSEGDQVYLSQDVAGTFVVLQDAVEFDATFNGESLGRLPDGTGRLTRLAETSFGSANGETKVGPLVISEVNYHPSNPSASALAVDSTITDNDLEYIEIANPTSADVDLTNWRIRGEADFDFVGGTLAAGESIVIVSFDPAVDTAKLNAFRAQYDIGVEVVIVGGLSASLSNSTGRIALQQPDAPDALGVIPNVVVDEVVYDDLLPWPDADGSGQSLERDDFEGNGSFATSWIAATPTPGAFEATPFLLGDAGLNGVVNFLDISPFISLLGSGTFLDQADVNRDGMVNFLDIGPFISLLSAS